MRALPFPLRSRSSGWLAIVAVAALLLSACGGGSQSAPTGPAKLAPTAPSASASPASGSPAVASPAVPSPSPAASASPVGGPAVVASPSPSPAASPAALAPPSRKLSVVATTTQIQDFVRNVGGERVELVPILAPLTDPHDYQPTAEDARKLAQADAIFYNGVGLEPWLEDLAKNARSGVPVINLAEAASLPIEAGADHAEGEEHDEEKPGEADEHEEEHEEGDPHVWYDPTNVQKMVNVIRDTLAKAESPGAPVYQANATTYNRELDRLDQQIKQQIASLPESQRKLVTSHESYGYYVKRYGLELVGTVIPSTSTEAEPSAGELQELIQKIRRENVKAIFTQRGQNPRLEQQIAQQAGVKVVSDLYAESLGPSGSDGDTYIKAMLHDTRVITEALR